MAAIKAAEKYRASVPRSKSFPWYNKSIGESLKPACRELLVKYSKIPEDSLEQHVYEVVGFVIDFEIIFSLTVCVARLCLGNLSIPLYWWILVPHVRALHAPIL